MVAVAAARRSGRSGGAERRAAPRGGANQAGEAHLEGVGGLRACRGTQEEKALRRDTRWHA